MRTPCQQHDRVPQEKVGLSPRRGRRRGISLLETLLALGIGAVILISSVNGVQRYTEGVRVEATALHMKRLGEAAEQWAGSRFASLVTEAPREYPITELTPFLREAPGLDAFKNSYWLTTRRYSVPGPNSTTSDALQVLVLAKRQPGDAALRDDPVLRSRIASTAGANAAFISSDPLSCRDASGAAMPNDSVCGAFGAFAIRSSQFSGTTDFAEATVGYLVTKGDSAATDDSLKRYDLGEAELNTMRTNIAMAGNAIEGAGSVETALVTGTQRIEMSGTDNRIDMAGTNSRIDMAGSTARLRAGTGTLRLEARNNLQLRSDSATGATIIGDSRNKTVSGRTSAHGTQNLLAGGVFAEQVRTAGVSSLTDSPNDPLMLQPRPDGEAIVGQRVDYRPAAGTASAGSGGRYDLSDGRLTAGHVKAVDVTCADCGGSLSEILPKWRHMGTYFIPAAMPGVNQVGRTVPKPNCTGNRRDPLSRAANEAGPAYAESSADNRYVARIIVVPRQLQSRVPYRINGNGNQAYATFDFLYHARDRGTYWDVYPQARHQFSAATALAMTYCVFVGGAVPSPESATIPALLP